jgi:putative PIN family toxin of toxin-antitoxin system
MSQIVVFDTNILLSALFSLRGAPFRCVELAKLGEIQSVTCQQILDEFEEKLLYKFDFSPQRAKAAVEEIRKISKRVELKEIPLVIQLDPDDDKFLACAVQGKATHIISGDKKHVLPLKINQGIKITGAADFLIEILQP